MAQSLQKLVPTKLFMDQLDQLYCPLLLCILFLFHSIQNRYQNLDRSNKYQSLTIRDLFFIFQRRVKVKDTKIFYLHGGFLDRVDGMLLGIPVASSYFLYI